MKVWRDIFSAGNWNQAVARFKLGQPDTPNAITTGSADARGGVARLRSVFERKLSSPTAFLEHLTTKITRYHDIPKHDYSKLDLRITALKEISKEANEYLSVFKVDLNQASVRNSEHVKDNYLRSHPTSNMRSETMDRLVLSLARRSLRKAGYLAQLKSYYSGTGGGASHRSPDKLKALLKAPQENDNGLVGLVPHVRMERLDPVHRSDYEADTTPGSTGYALQLWLKDSRDTPFFLWLENSKVCLEDNKGELFAQSVPYERFDQRIGGDTSQQMIIVLPAPLHALSLDGGNMRIASTAGCTADPDKDPSTKKGVGLAAYVWSAEGELFVAEHRGNVFHHSSFVSGNKVRCAGMISIENGLCTFVSNNSGHYKPRKDKLLTFVNYLRVARALHANAMVAVQTGNGKPWYGTAAHFVRDYATI